MDDLNEAYSILRHSERRDAFDRIRDALLGSKALPLAPVPPAEAVPLSVMERQRPRPREEGATATTPPARRSRWPMPHLSIPGWQHYVSAGMFFALAVVSLVWAQPVVVVTLFAVGVAVTLIPLARRGPRLSKRTKSPKPRSKAGPKEHRRGVAQNAPSSAQADAATALHEATQDARERLRKAPRARTSVAPIDDRVALQGKS